MTLFADSSKVLLSIDSENEYKLPKNFRILKDNNVKASASGQFSEQGLFKILDTIKQDKNNIYIIDLRQESHGFLNGIAVSLYGHQNAGNKNKDISEIKLSENKFIQTIKNKDFVELNYLKKLGEGRVTSGSSIKISVKKALSEQELVEGLNLNYKRFYVLDHNKPSKETVKLFSDFIQTIPDNAWVHFHCRGGRGRATTAMVMYYIVKNKDIIKQKKMSLDNIIKLQEEIGGANLLEFEKNLESKKWKEAPAKARYQLLQEFYDLVIN